jgi:hypothetical protein
VNLNEDSKMPVQLTGPMQKEMTPELMLRIDQALREFPELLDRKVTVGLVRSDNYHGNAEAQNMIIRLNTRRRSGTSYFTIGHELTHLLQSPGLRIVPDGEVQCDIFTLARSPLFTDDMPTYLGLPCSNSTWKHYVDGVRHLCIQAVEVRKTRRTYISWLNEALRQYFAATSYDMLSSNSAHRA